MESPQDPVEQRLLQRLARIEERRVRHHARAMPIRVVVAVVGFVLLIPAAPLAIVLPELGVPLLLVALSVLALEFEWAVRALEWVVRTWERIKAWYRSLGGAGKGVFWIVAIGVAWGLVWLLQRFHPW